MIPDEAILEAIRRHIGENGYSPSAMKYRLDRLREKGLVKFDKHKPRTIRVVEHD